jgi:alkylation response protein AidB-like acyl-CoA dehydrogenase
MNFQTTEITKQVSEMCRDFARQHIKPFVMEWDEQQIFPTQVFKEMGKLGLMGILVPEH